MAKQLKRIQGDRTQAEFSKRLGIGQASLNRILQAQQGVSLDLLETMCNSLRVDAVELLWDPEAMKKRDSDAAKWVYTHSNPRALRGDPPDQ